MSCSRQQTVRGSTVSDPEKASLKEQQQEQKQHAAGEQHSTQQQQALCVVPASRLACCSLPNNQPTAASIDWEDWITARLKRAAARRTTSSGGNLAQQQQQPGALARHGNISLRTPSKAQHPAGVSCQGISSSRRSSTADAGQQAPDWKVCSRNRPDDHASTECRHVPSRLLRPLLLCRRKM
jgi:hypothetical protein